jgi:hypothetical protein
VRAKQGEIMTDKTYHHESGKGSHRRKEDKQAFEKNFDTIDWSVKSSTSVASETKPKNPVCKVCHGERGSFDAGHWYECTACEESV